MRRRERGGARLTRFPDDAAASCSLVERAFRGFHHFYDTRGNNGLLEWVRGFDPEATLPTYSTMTQLLEIFEEEQDKIVACIIKQHIAKYGKPCCGAAADIWSLKSCRQSFACLTVTVTCNRNRNPNRNPNRL